MVRAPAKKPLEQLAYTTKEIRLDHLTRRRFVQPRRRPKVSFLTNHGLPARVQGV